MGTRKPKNPTPEARRHFPHDRIGLAAPASKAPEVHQTATADRQRNGNETAVLKCPKCGQSVATLPAAEAWCLPCGARMQPVKGKARP